MIQKKICLLGAFAVGKTSLVQQFVNSIFSDKYHTTLGVKIDKKIVQVDGEDVKLMIWDLAGEDEFMKVRMSYLRGASGFLYVIDGTRSDTLDTMKMLKDKVEREFGKLPFIVLINKSDLEDKWQIDAQAQALLSKNGWQIHQTSAKNGIHVDDAFKNLAYKMIECSQ